MKNTILVGAGGHAAEIVDYLNFNAKYDPNFDIRLIGVIDDDTTNYEHYSFNIPFLGSIKSHVVEDCFYLMAIANIDFRSLIVSQLKESGAQFIGYSHPLALISPTAIIGEGTIVSHNVSIGPKVKIGDFNVLNSRCTIGHDTLIGDFNFISPGVSLGGNTQIGSGNILGTHSCTIPGVKIGDNNKIAAGMVVTDQIGDMETVFYRFKERMIAKGL